MEISAINPLWGNEFSNSTLKATEVKESGAAFIDILTSAVENVKTTDVEKNELEYLLSVGQLDNPAELTIATAKAQSAVDLLVQLRTKSLESYNEIIRMSI